TGSIRLVGVSTQGAGRTAAVLIESAEPVAYAVTRPDPLTVLVDLRNVTVGDVASQPGRQGPVAGVTLEQAKGIDGKELARVRVALAAPAEYKVRSARNVIRLELEPATAAAFAPPAAHAPAMPLPIDEVATADTTPAAPAAKAPAAAATTAVAPELQKVRASHTCTSTTITLAGNGRLNPASLTESDEQPRRLMLDFPNVASSAAARTSVDGVFVKNVRVALDSRDPLLTRVTMEISATATYHVERTGPDGRDLSVVFEGGKPHGVVLIAPRTAPEKADKDDKDDTISFAEALANGAAMAPPDPMTAVSSAFAAKPAPRSARETPRGEKGNAETEKSAAADTAQPPQAPAH